MDFSREQLMFEIQKVGFAASDLHLYLDTHPTDKNAIMLYNTYIMQLRRLNDMFERNFGMISFDSPSYTCPFNWVMPTWPWMPMMVQNQCYRDEEE